jgi:hypothetical protein
MNEIAFFFLLIPCISFSQSKPVFGQPIGQQPIKVEVTKTPTLAESFNEGYKEMLLEKTAKASETNTISNALNNNYEKIYIDLLKNHSNKYKSIAIKKVSGYAVIANFETICKEIKNAKKYTLINEIDKIQGKNDINKNEYFEPTINDFYKNDSTTLFLEWTREALSEYDKITRLIIKNNKGESLFQAEYKNKSFIEMLRPVTTEYRMTIEEAKSILIKLKEYLDLGIISQLEYENKASPLKRILLNF